jgi:hypothetical protein
MKNPRLEELRKRLLTPPLLSDRPRILPAKFFRPGRSVPSTQQWSSPKAPPAWTKVSAREVRHRPCSPAQGSPCLVSCSAPPSTCTEPKQVTTSATFQTGLIWGLPNNTLLRSTAVLQAQSGEGF